MLDETHTVTNYLPRVELKELRTRVTNDFLDADISYILATK